MHQIREASLKQLHIMLPMHHPPADCTTRQPGDRSSSYAMVNTYPDRCWASMQNIYIHWCGVLDCNGAVSRPPESSCFHISDRNYNNVVL